MIYIDVETTEGIVICSYMPTRFRRSWNWRHMYITVSGRMSWMVSGGRSHRDLQADLEEAQPGVTILEVNGFLIRGSGRVDDIRLLSVMPPSPPSSNYEDAEDGTTAGWDVYDNDSCRRDHCKCV